MVVLDLPGQDPGKLTPAIRVAMGHSTTKYDLLKQYSSGCSDFDVRVSLHWERNRVFSLELNRNAIRC